MKYNVKLLLNMQGSRVKWAKIVIFIIFSWNMGDIFMFHFVFYLYFIEHTL